MFKRRALAMLAALAMALGGVGFPTSYSSHAAWNQLVASAPGGDCDSDCTWQ
jgi:hypothetical protein